MDERTRNAHLRVVLQKLRMERELDVTTPAFSRDEKAALFEHLDAKLTAGELD